MRKLVKGLIIGAVALTLAGVSSNAKAEAKTFKVTINAKSKKSIEKAAKKLYRIECYSYGIKNWKTYKAGSKKPSGKFRKNTKIKVTFKNVKSKKASVIAYKKACKELLKLENPTWWKNCQKYGGQMKVFAGYYSDGVSAFDYSTRGHEWENCKRIVKYKKASGSKYKVTYTVDNDFKYYIKNGYYREKNLVNMEKWVSTQQAKLDKAYAVNNLKKTENVKFLDRVALIAHWIGSRMGQGFKTRVVTDEMVYKRKCSEMICSCRAQLAANYLCYAGYSKWVCTYVMRDQEHEINAMKRGGKYYLFDVNAILNALDVSRYVWGVEHPVYDEETDIGYGVGTVMQDCFCSGKLLPVGEMFKTMSFGEFLLAPSTNNTIHERTYIIYGWAKGKLVSSSPKRFFVTEFGGW